MSEHQSGPVELGAPMDYAEHEKSYNMFIVGAKFGTMFIVALLIAMAAGFFTAAGFLGSVILFLVLSVLGVFLLR
jgi:hypothetical protein